MSQLFPARAIATVRGIEVDRVRLTGPVLAFSGVEVPPKQ